MKVTKKRIIDALAKLDEPTFTNDVVIPLIEKVHPGLVEYTHSPLEAGRDIVSIGRDFIGRRHILCVQVKAISLSYGAAAFKAVANAAEAALSIEVTLEDGRIAHPSEVWLVSSRTFTEEKRRQLQGLITDLDRKNIKLIAADELCTLILTHIPQVASSLSSYASRDVLNFVSWLSIHHEGRAFGFSRDRSLDEFYVTTTLSPYIAKVNLALEQKLTLRDFSRAYSWHVLNLLDMHDYNLTDRDLELKASKAIGEIESARYFDDYPVNVEVTLNASAQQIRKKLFESIEFQARDLIQPQTFIIRLRSKEAIPSYVFRALSAEVRSDLVRVNKSRTASAATIEKLIEDLNEFLRDKDFVQVCLNDDPELKPEIDKILINQHDEHQLALANRFCFDEYFNFEISDVSREGRGFITGKVDFRLSRTLEDLIKTARRIIRGCPNVLSKDATKVKETVSRMAKMENFLASIPTDLVQTTGNVTDSTFNSQLRLRVKEPRNLLNLDKLIVIEGPPGCGKTTLMRMLGIELLGFTEKVLYLPCFKIEPTSDKKSFKKLLSTFCFGPGNVDWDGNLEDYSLLIDGLDEAPFDLSGKIFKNHEKFANVVVSTRRAFDTDLRNHFVSIAVAPFSREERDEFFRLWFKGRTDHQETVRHLIDTYKDIDLHTRLPLIATITVGLIQGGFKPTTRAEIYSDRLTLLLSSWDRLRGVSRLKIDHPEAKLRFLRNLAYGIHSDSGRKRHQSDIDILRRRQIDLDDLLDIYEQSLGRWGYAYNSPQSMIDDLILGSGILIEERPKVFSFGHLTFQEHLVGGYIFEEYSISGIAQMLGDDWWREPLNFYASMKGDISDLIEFAQERGSMFLANAQQLYEMIKYAPYTSPGAIACVEDTIDLRLNE